MAERCPYCGSKDISTSVIGFAEKSVEGIATGTVALMGKIGYGLKTGNFQGPQGFLGKIAGTIVDGICTEAADSLTKNIPTGRKCNRCGKYFHATPDKGWWKN